MRLDMMQSIAEHFKKGMQNAPGLGTKYVWKQLTYEVTQKHMRNKQLLYTYTYIYKSLKIYSTFKFQTFRYQSSSVNAV